MREILFRGKYKDEWKYGIFECPYFILQTDGDRYVVNINTVGEWSGLKDKNGINIFEGDILKFDDEDGIWTSSVEFTRGLFTIKDPIQIKNPDGWKEKHDRVESRWWSVHWGYGTVLEYEKPLAQKTVYKVNIGEDAEAYSSEYKKWHEKYGWSNWRVDAEIVGNIYDNPELLKEKTND